jgi:6-phosphofructo-2-kinase/fructose-2,6-biphosphatase 2
MQTASYLKFQKKTWKSLDELDAGVCDGMTYEEIEVSFSSLVTSLEADGIAKVPRRLRKSRRR